jgi:hypothetical protein
MISDIMFDVYLTLLVCIEEMATEEKIRLEEKQRTSRRDRQKKNIEWKPL